MNIRNFVFAASLSVLALNFSSAQGHHDAHGTQPAHGAEAHSKDTSAHSAAHTEGGASHAAHAEHAAGCGHAEAPADEKYTPTADIMNHIANANEFHLFGDVSIPLPCILYSKEDGIKTFMSSKLHHGALSFDRYVIDHGAVKRIKDAAFPAGEQHLDAVHEENGHKHYIKHKDGKSFVAFGGNCYELEAATNLFAPSSFYDFSISKNVATMLLAGFLLLFIGIKVANSYKKENSNAPKGLLTNMIESMIQFITEEVAIPMIGEKKYLRFLPYLLTVFFFILINNLFGLIPIFPFGANVTGNIATTAALALITFIITNINGNKDYWGHIFWMPGVPVPMKIFLAPIELIGIFTKPISLMIRLFANITAGHIIILALVGLIFVFGNNGKSVGGSYVGLAIAAPFTCFLMVIEIIVAFIQAFIFTILTASYIGGATAEHHHDEHH